jgi:hypothetical protein
MKKKKNWLKNWKNYRKKKIILKIDLYQKEAEILLKKDMKHLVMEFKKCRIWKISIY